MRPNGGLVTANGGNIKFPRICSNILGHFRTQIIFRQGHEVDLDSGMVLFKDLLRRLLVLHSSLYISPYRMPQCSKKYNVQWLQKHYMDGRERLNNENL